MLVPIESTDFERLRPLFAPLNMHLTTLSLLDGLTPASVFADSRQTPTAVFARAGHRFFLTGSPANATFNQALAHHFAEDIYPWARRTGEIGAFVLCYAPGWEAVIPHVLRGKHAMHRARRYYVREARPAAWREQLPPDLVLRPVDAALLAATHLENLDGLREEMCSERPSLEAFLQHSFGVCAVQGETIAGWCLSEYNWNGRCEVGIETRPAFRQRGIATLLTHALVEEAFDRGLREVGWHCWADNEPSWRTAKRAGFRHVCDYPTYFALFDEVLNLAVNGNLSFEQDDFAGAHRWYARAIAQGAAQPWVFWNAACAAAQAGILESVADYVRTAVAHGLDDFDRIRHSPHLEPLHGTDAWRALLAELSPP